jgi:hypothetical protein
MATYSKQILSGSVNGLAEKVTGTSTMSSVMVHTAVSGSTNFDEIWLYANNTSSTASKLTIEWGTPTAADGNIELSVQPESGLILVIPGLLLNGGHVVRAFASAANVILLTGYVNAIRS